MRPIRSEIPFRPESVPFYYGWVILVVSTIGLIMSAPGQTVGISVFTEPLLSATSLSRLEFSNAYLIGTLASGLMLPYAGTLIDRFGVRLAAIAASIGLGSVMAFLSQVDHAAESLARFGLSQSAAAYALLTVAFWALRFSGQGVLTLVSRTMLGHWFERRRGLVSAISGPFANFAFGGSPLLLGAWVQANGWRDTWLQMALIVGLGMGTLAWLFFRENPEEAGLLIDGIAVPDAPAANAPLGTSARPLPKPRPDFTRAEAVRTTAFWVIVLGIANQALVGTGIALHIVDIGAEVGMSESQALGVFLPVTLISIPTSIITGLLIDRFPARYLIMAMCAGQVLMFGLVPHLDDPVLYWACVGGWGFSGGFYGPLTVAALPNFFGRAHLGAIQGVMMMTTVIASALGPAIFAGGQAYFGNYATCLYALVALPLLGFVLAPWTREPRKRRSA